MSENVTAFATDAAALKREAAARRQQLLEAKDLAAWKRVFQLRVERRKRWYATIDQAKLAADGGILPGGAPPVTKRDSYSHGSRRMSAISATDAPACERCPERGVTEL